MCDRVIVILFPIKGLDLAIENDNQYQCKKSKFWKIKVTRYDVFCLKNKNTSLPHSITECCIVFMFCDIQCATCYVKQSMCNMLCVTYKHTSAVSKSAEAIWRGITWPDTIRALTKQNEEQDIWNKHVNACVVMYNAMCEMQCVTCIVTCIVRHVMYCNNKWWNVLTSLELQFATWNGDFIVTPTFWNLHISKYDKIQLIMII